MIVIAYILLCHICYYYQPNCVRFPIIHKPYHNKSFPDKKHVSIIIG